MDSSSPHDQPERLRSLEHFRANTKRLKIHPTELLLLAIIGLHVVFLPWAIGGMRPWSQVISLTLGIISLGVALVPRNYTPEESGSNTFRLYPWPRLKSFPIFWIGLLLVGYITIQGLNPAWSYFQSDRGWWMQSIDHINWLPSGVNVPWARGGPWRKLIIYAAAWMTVCAIWTGFTRRRTLQFFFLVVALNGLALAIFGLAQKLLPNGKMFWFVEIPYGSLFASFVYKNHAAAYLVLTLFVICGLASWHYLRGLRRLEKSNPAGLFAFFATCIASTILVSYARGVTIVMLVFLVGAVGAFIFHQIAVPNTTRKPVVAVALMLIFGYFLRTGLQTVSSHEAWTRLGQGISDQDLSLTVRGVATTASIDMLKDNWGTGTGAGGYAFLFPTYQQRYPEIYYYPGGQRMFWEHAHNDLVEISVELGLPGILLILAGAAFWLTALCRQFFWRNPMSVCVVFGSLLLVGYSWWDFPFQNPAVLMLWCSLAIATVLWTTFEEQNLKG